MPQLIIFSGFICYKCLVRALLYDGAFMEYYDLITELAGGQPVADVDSGFVTCDVIEFFIDLGLGDRV